MAKSQRVLDYLECAAWCNEENDEYILPLPSQAHADLEKFEAMCKERDIDLDAYEIEHPNLSIGHDFYLTRCRHGAGFWDRGLEKKLGEILTGIAQTFSDDV